MRVARFSAMLMVSMAVAFFTSVGTASAHAVLDSSSPAASTVLESSPSEIRLSFNEDVESSLLEIRLFGADQEEILLSAAERAPQDASQVRADVPRLDAGVYVVVWRVMSADGHPATGAFPFEIGRTTSGTGSDLVAQVLSGLDDSSPLETPMAVSRLVAFVAVVGLIGALALTWGTSLSSAPVLRRWFATCVAMLLAGTVGIVALQGGYVTGRSWESVFDASLWSDVLGTRLGLASIVRFATVVCWGGLFLTLHRARDSWWQNLAVVVSAVTVLTFSVSGHSSAASWPMIFIVVDAIHFGAIAVWVGGLIALYLLRREASVDVHRFSTMATRAVPVVVVTGVAQGLHLMEGPGDLTSTRYGQLLLAKVLLFGVLVLAGAAARQRITEGSVAPIGSILRVDAALVIAVLAITSVLVGTPPGSTENPADRTFSSTQIEADVMVDLTVVPTRVGAAEVHVIITPPGGALAPVADATVEFELPERRIPPIPVSMVELGPNHWSGIVQFPYAGQWSMKVRVEDAPGSTIAYDAIVDVAG